MNMSTLSLSHGLEGEHLDLVVKRITVSLQAEYYRVYPDAHEATHAVLYLLTEDCNSIEINMGASARSLKGRLVIRHRPFRKHKHAFKRFSVAAYPGMEVRDFLCEIERMGRHLYRYHHSGKGCRFWV